MWTAISVHLAALFGLILHFCLSTDIETFYPTSHYCEGNTFGAECAPHEVIMIHAALYGRMYAGICLIEGDPIGCKADVTRILDGHCSGRRSCSVNVVDVFQSMTPDMKPCPANFRAFLEVSYKCIKVHQPSDTCEVHLNNLPSPVGFLSSFLSEPKSCGSIDVDKPWVFTGMQEQRINFILYDFSGVDSPGVGADSCTVYVTIKEAELHEFKTVCQSPERQTQVYTSKSNRVEVRISKREHEFFLLKFEVQGCISFKVPTGGWVKRSGNVAEVGCDGTSNTWKVHCQGNKWVGPIGNCSAYSSQPRSDASIGDSENIFLGLFGSHWLAALAISAIAFTVALSILVAGIVYLKRRQVPLGSGHMHDGSQPYYKYATGAPGAPGVPSGQQAIYSRNTAPTRTFDPNDNEYLKTIERQRLMLIGQHPQQQFAPSDNIRWQDGEHIYELPQFDTVPAKPKKDPVVQGFQKQSFELNPRGANQGPSQDNLDSSIRNVNNRSV